MGIEYDGTNYCINALKRIFVVAVGETIRDRLGNKRPRILGETMTTNADRKKLASLLDEIRCLCDDAEQAYESGQWYRASSMGHLMAFRARSVSTIASRAWKMRYPSAVWSWVRLREVKRD